MVEQRKDLVNIAIGLVPDQHDAEAAFTKQGHPEPYRLWIEFEEDDPETPWRVNDSSDADPSYHHTYREALDQFAENVAFQIVFDGDPDEEVD